LRNLLRTGSLAILFGSLFFAIGCDNNEDIIPDDPEAQYAAELLLEEGLGNKNANVYISDLHHDSTSFEVLVTFKSTESTMRRLYMTENIAGAGAEPFELLLDDLDKKGDGSLDIENNQGNEFTFALPFNILSSLSEGTVEYKLWATNGRGDYRDAENSFAVGIGTLTVDYGGQNPATAVKEFSAKMFAAPLADGSSETFISLLDGTLYRIDQGEEFVSFWDFGYYYGGTHHASLSSPNDYPSSIIDIATVANTTATLNSSFFSLSSNTSDDFNAIISSNDLDYITTSVEETITGLETGNIIEFVDNYGKKGLIEIVEIKGTYNSGDYMTINIKVQP
jgi:hypothetical protein